MGFLSEIKKLVFGVESVAKNQAREAAKKGAEYSKEALEDAAEFSKETFDKASKKGQEWFEEAKEVGGTLKKRVNEVAEDLEHKFEEKMEEFSSKHSETKKSTTEPTTTKKSNFQAEAPNTNPTDATKESMHTPSAHADSEPTVDNADDMVEKIVQETTDELRDKNTAPAQEEKNEIADAVEKVGGQVLSKGEQALEKGAEFTEKVGSKVLSEGEKLAEKLGQISEKVGEKVLGKANDMVDKAKDAVNNSDETLDKVMDRAKELGDKIESKVKHQDTKLSDKTGYDQYGSSLLSGHDDFFEKAQRFAEGDYRNEGKKEEPSKEKTNMPDLELPKDEDYDDVEGYSDSKE